MREDLASCGPSASHRQSRSAPRSRRPRRRAGDDTEAAADDPDAIGEQRGSDAVAFEAEIGLAVERERERLAAIDGAAGGKPKSAHERVPDEGSVPMTALVEVSRVIANNFHAGHVQPDFPARAFRIGVEMEIRGPLDVADRLGRLGPRLRLADIVEFGLVARTAERAGKICMRGL